MRAGRKQEPILVKQPAVHGIAGVDILGDREVHEVDGSDNRNLSRPHISFIDESPHAAPMVTMRVRVDHRRYWEAFADVLLKQFPGSADGFGANQWVKNDPAGLASDKRDVGQVEAPNLIDAGDDLVETIIVVQLGLTQQRGMDAVELVLFIQKLESLHIPSDMAGIRHDLEV